MGTCAQIRSKVGLSVTLQWHPPSLVASPLGCVGPPPSNFESPSFCHGLCSAEGMGVCQGLGGDLVSPSTARTFLASCWGTACARAPHPTLLPPPQCILGRGVYCCTAETVKLNFPDVQAPGACVCCLERKWGLGRAVVFFPCSPCFSGATKCGQSSKSWLASISQFSLLP